MPLAPAVARAERRAMHFLQDVATINRSTSAQDDTAASAPAVTVVAAGVPCSFEPYRMPEEMAVTAGRLEAHVRWTFQFPRSFGGVALDPQVGDTIVATESVSGRQATFTIETPLFPWTRAVFQTWLANRTT